MEREECHWDKDSATQKCFKVPIFCFLKRKEDRWRYLEIFSMFRYIMLFGSPSYWDRTKFFTFKENSYELSSYLINGSMKFSNIKKCKKWFHTKLLSCTWENCIAEEKVPEALASLNRVASTRSNLTAKSKRGGQRSVTRLRGYGEPTLSHNAPLNPTIAETTRPKCNFTTLYQDKLSCRVTCNRLHFVWRE